MRLTILAVMCALAMSGSAAAQQARQAPQPPPAPPAPQRTQTQTNTQSTTRTTTVGAPAAPDALAPPPPPPAPPAPGAGSRFQPVNVKIDFTITDQRNGTAPINRTVSVIASDGYLGRVRSRSTVTIVGMATPIPLDIDATPVVLSDGKIRLQLALSYDLPGPEPTASETRRIISSSIQDTVTLILADGKPIVAAQSADPIGDRQVSIEVKATVLK